MVNQILELNRLGQFLIHQKSRLSIWNFSLTKVGNAVFCSRTLPPPPNKKTYCSALDPTPLYQPPFKKRTTVYPQLCSARINKKISISETSSLCRVKGSQFREFLLGVSESDQIISRCDLLYT